MGDGVELLHGTQAVLNSAHRASTLRLSGSFKALQGRGRRGQLGRQDWVPLPPQLALLNSSLSRDGCQPLLAGPGMRS